VDAVTRTSEYGSDRIDERFLGPDLDPAVWTAAYLPAWSSRAEAAATYALTPAGLRLSIPPDQGLWCPDRHFPPLRVSAVQTGNWSGPVGSTSGQQPFAEGLTVREQQPTTWGYTPRFGRLEVELRAGIGPRSMFSAWMVGLEQEPDQCGEICVVEVFGDTVRNGRVGLGCGIKAIRDPALTSEFEAEPTALDVARPHVYAVDWRPGRVDFFVDGEWVRTTSQAPDYPMQLILGVFDFPDPDASRISESVPELVVHRVTGQP
jgi:Glycosyl hydrolases family 16